MKTPQIEAMAGMTPLGIKPGKRMGRNWITPELTEALRGLLAYVDQFGSHTNDNRVTRAREELAKAEGNS